MTTDSGKTLTAEERAFRAGYAAGAAAAWDNSHEYDPDGSVSFASYRRALSSAPDARSSGGVGEGDTLEPIPPCHHCGAREGYMHDDGCAALSSTEGRAS